MNQPTYYIPYLVEDTFKPSDKTGREERKTQTHTHRHKIKINIEITVYELWMHTYALWSLGVGL
jgi:hypothetical protein